MKYFKRTVFYVGLAAFILTLTGTSSGQERESDRAFNFAVKLYDDGLYSLASRELKAFQSRYPGHELADKALLLAAKTDLKTEQNQQAFEALRNLEITYPQSPFLPEARFLLAQSKEKQKAYLEAARLYHRVFELHSDSEKAQEALLSAGRLFRMAGENGQAVSAFKAVILNYPDSPARIDAHLEIVRTYKKEGQLQQALREVDAVLSIFGSNLNEPRVQIARGEIFLGLGQYEAATKAFTSATASRSDQDLSRAFYGLSQIQGKKRQFAEAIDNLTRVISNTTDSALRVKALSDRAALYEKTSANDAAIADYRKAIESLSPEAASDLQLRYAHALASDSDLEAADRVLGDLRKRIDTLSPAQANQILLDLADVNVKRERYQVAVKYLREVRSRTIEGPVYQTALWSEASVFSLHLDDCDTAVRLYKEIVQLGNSSDADQAQLEVARCYERASDWPRALQAYRRYLEIFPAGDQASLVEARAELISAAKRLDSADPVRELSKLIGMASSIDQPDDRKLLLGKAYLDLKEFGAALEQFDGLSDARRRANAVSTAKAHAGLGKSLLLDGQMDPAIKRFNMADALLRPVLRDSVGGSGFKEAFELMVGMVPHYSDSSRTRRYRQLLEIGRKSDAPEAVSQLEYGLANELYLGSNPESSQFAEAQELLKDALNTSGDRHELDRCAFLLAAMYERAGKDSLAILRYQQLLKEPVGRDGVAAMVHLARLLKDGGQVERSIGLLRRVRSTYFYSNLANVASRMLADIYLGQGLLDSAAVLYDQLTVTSAVKSTNGYLIEDDLLFRKALILERSGRLTDALSGYLSFIEAAGESPVIDDAKQAVARIALELNNRNLAMEYYELLARDATLANNRAIAHKKLGDLLFDQGKYSAARTHFQSAGTLFEDENDKRSAAAEAIRCAIKLKQFSLADGEIKTFKKKFDDTKEDEGQFLFDKGNEYVAEKNFDRAEDVFKDLKDDFKKTELGAKGEFGLGKVYMITNHTEDALKILTELPAKYPDSETAALSFYNLGDFYYKSQHVQNAIHAFRMAAEHPKAGALRERCLLYLIQCYRDVKMWEQAIDVIHQYLDQYPHTEYTFDRRVDLGTALLGLKEYDRAIALFRELLVYAKPESEAEIQFNIAECYKQQGDLYRAATEYLKVKYLTAPSKLPWHVTALFEAGDCLVQLGEYGQAQDILNRIIKEEGSESNFGRFALKKLDLLASKSNPQ